jgi:hypothetical protein
VTSQTVVGRKGVPKKGLRKAEIKSWQDSEKSPHYSFLLEKLFQK